MIEYRNKILLVKDQDIAKRETKIDELIAKIDSLKQKTNVKDENHDPKSKAEKSVQKKTNKTKIAQNSYRLC